MGKLVGYVLGEKDGNRYGRMFVVNEASASMRSRGYVGCTVDAVWIPKDDLSLFAPSVIGKEVNCEYEIVGKQAYLQSVSFK